ncbi:MAG: serine hydrolase [Anaerolineaceae bacterium]|nr:serine hydrolase [Anaerolineaceae bacterium]
MKIKLVTHIVGLLALGLLLAACMPGPAPAQPSGPYWPTGDWRTAAPEEQGMDAHKLAQMQAAIEQEDLALHSLLVIRNGYIVSETYYGKYTANDRHDLYSCTKSFVSTLVGIAIDQGLIDGTGQRMLAYFSGHSFANVDARKEAMTLADVLSMQTGLAWEEGDPAYISLSRSPDWVAYMLDLPMQAPPGSQFNYCSGCSHLLSAMVGQASETGARDFAERYLFKPLGIRQARWDIDPHGNPIGGWGLQLTPREMAKLGYLYLHHGEWDGQQVVPAQWVAEATRRHAGDEGELGYGYQWWTYPALDAYTALGRGGQTIFVVPGADLVIVTTADLEDHDAIFDLIETYIVPAVQT